MLRKELLQLLCCPKCHGSLNEIAEPSGLHCVSCHLFYAIEDGIPNLIIEEAASDGILHPSISSPL